MSEPTLILGRVGSEAAGKDNKILYTPSNEPQQDPGVRGFATLGEVDEAGLYRAIEYLRQSNLFQAVHHAGAGVVVRIVHKPTYDWSSPLIFPEGRPPASLAIVREKLGERHGDITMLAYVIAMLCDGAGWDGHNVTISECDF